MKKSRVEVAEQAKLTWFRCGEQHHSVRAIREAMHDSYDEGKDTVEAELNKILDSMVCSGCGGGSEFCECDLTLKLLKLVGMERSI